MAPQPMDALSSFVFLTDNLPAWVVQINDLADHTLRRHGEFAAEYSRLLKHACPRKPKSPSLASNRSNDRLSESRGSPARSITSQDRARLNPLEAGNKYLFASAREKEKNTGATVRSGASASRKFRQKHAVVIYYDGHVQTSLEAMVKNISTARNNLRKGKKSRDLMKGPMFSLNGFSSTIPDFKPSTFAASSVNLNPKDEKNAPAEQTPSDIDKCFELADKSLEQAQNLCESAAHLFLRDGDSSVELRNSTTRLARAIKIAEGAVEKLKVEEANAQHDTEGADAAVEETNEFKFTLPPFPISKAYTPKADHGSAIEVDSAEEDVALQEDYEKEIDISRFRCNMRSNAFGI